MTVSSTSSNNAYVGAGNTATYAYTFRVYEESDLYVRQVDTNNNVTIPAFTATGVGNEGGGTITLSANLPIGHILYIRFRTEINQETDLRNQGGYHPEVVEDALDRIVRICQQLQTQIDDAGAIPSATVVSAYMKTVLDEETAAGAQNELGIAPSLTPEQEGAEGDDTEDDTAALQAIFDGIESGDVIELRRNYRITDTLTITGKSNFRIHGPGRIRQVTEDKRLLSVTDCDDWSIEGVRFSGVGTDFNGTADTSLGDALWITGSNNFEVRRCHFRNFGHTAINVATSHDFDIVRNTIVGTDNLSSPITPNVDVFQFGIRIQGVGALATSPTNFLIFGNKISDVAIGINVHPGSRIYSIIGNLIRNIGMHGVYSEGQDYEVNNNILHTLGSIGIKVASFWMAGPISDPATKISVSGNVIVLCISGITIEKVGASADPAHTITVSGNTIYNANGGYAIYAADADNINIGNNTVAFATYGIYTTLTATGCSGSIHDNVLSDISLAAIVGTTNDQMDVKGNRILRPCTSGNVGHPTNDVIYLAGTAGTDRFNVSDNTIRLDTSIGGAFGIYGVNCEIWLGQNDYGTVTTAAGGSGATTVAHVSPTLP